ncbi:hypothetical protein FKM82_031136 [Ascaphus truei]
MSACTKGIGRLWKRYSIFGRRFIFTLCILPIHEMLPFIQVRRSSPSVFMILRKFALYNVLYSLVRFTPKYLIPEGCHLN